MNITTWMDGAALFCGNIEKFIDMFKADSSTDVDLHVQMARTG